MEAAGRDREELLVQRRRENKEFRAKVQALKKEISKGDKKRKKEIHAEIAALEQKLQSCKEELTTLQASPAVNGCGLEAVEKDRVGGDDREGDDGGARGMEQVGVANGQAEKEDVGKMSRAQKRKAKKAQLERERAQRIAESEVAEITLPNARQQEREKLAALLTPLRLAIRDITPDGHCLYAAVSDQLSTRMNIKVSVSELRNACSEYIRVNSSEFLPYFTHSETDSQEEFDKYCREIAETAEWGGQPEIRAFSHIYQVSINVYQASVPVVCAGEEYMDTEPLNLSYHLHEYGLGEHYNSVIPIEMARETDEGN